VSKAMNVTAQALYRLRGDGIRDGEQMSLKWDWKNSHRGWGGDVLRQTYAHMATGKSRSLTVDSGVQLTVS